MMSFARLKISAGTRRRSFLRGLGLLALVGASTWGGLTGLRARPPNIIFILADDLGYTDVAAFGSKYYETPHIDRLAAQGMRFTNHHHCQNCTPTRAALMSGQYGARTGVYTVGSVERFDWRKRPLRPVENVTSLPLDRVLLPQTLQTAGYATAMFGKWHIGQQGAYLPGQRGFGEAIVSMGAHYDFNTNPKTEYPQGQYLADFLTDRAVDFIRRKKAEPFFLYLPHFGVHSPHEAKPELIARFKGKPGVGGHKNATYAAMIASVDESVGRVTALLEELKIAEQTVVIFASDNGGVGGYAREGIIKNAGDITDNAPLRSGKGSLYEGGTRVPLIVRWPGQVEAGSTCAVPTIHVDIYPTLAAIAGATMPAGQIADGESLVPLLRERGGQLAREAIFQHFPGYLGVGVDQWRTTPVSLVQMGDWKLLEFLEDGRLELYNLRTDLGETKNLAAALPERAQSMYARLVAWRAATQAAMPQKNVPAEGAESGTKKGKGKRKAAKE
jgi:arylsulfatase A-like enzyme